MIVFCSPISVALRCTGQVVLEHRTTHCCVFSLSGSILMHVEVSLWLFRVTELFSCNLQTILDFADDWVLLFELCLYLTGAVKINQRVVLMIICQLVLHEVYICEDSLKCNLSVCWVPAGLETSPMKTFILSMNSAWLWWEISCAGISKDSYHDLTDLYEKMAPLYCDSVSGVV